MGEYDDHNAMIFPDRFPQTVTKDVSDRPVSIVFTDGGYTWTRTITYDDVARTVVFSAWVRS